ncbi:hypothetical protein VDQ63_08660, partial [Xanthomonas campestris pv. campestris]|nr:hypothetical protein [Xanthomonas campestris pv. campestris]MEB1238033.1 hypothetical protein [Xanthomonas campestris pv. campestris]MEB1483452.1 hypothetical protein [Xanthomonas campestris pv. campestris]MEB1503121.1 hypothetical protein [Xanthomonas campestris pv. campestris]MEB1510762.1 hypothetical protein [Xanthomonas campestris pv. campestris]
ALARTACGSARADDAYGVKRGDTLDSVGVASYKISAIFFRHIYLFAALRCLFRRQKVGDCVSLNPKGGLSSRAW